MLGAADVALAMSVEVVINEPVAEAARALKTLPDKAWVVLGWSLSHSFDPRA